MGEGRRRGRVVACVVGAFLLGGVSARSQVPVPTPARPAAAGIAIGSLAWTHETVERAELPSKSEWRPVARGDDLRTGDTFRVSEAALARLDFPWMQVVLGPSSLLTIPASTVLSTVLEQGRAEFRGEGRDIVKIVVGEGEIRGGGRLVLRRSVGRTSATALEGSFRVRAAGRTVEIKAGEGTIVTDGRPPEPPAPLPPPPGDLVPGADPQYVRSGRPAELHWKASSPAYYVELLALQGDDVLLAQEARRSSARLELPWLGTYRWRVSARDARGLESPPSAAGLICSVDR
jgi:hypothetical protein